jgi:hypothetical protein
MKTGKYYKNILEKEGTGLYALYFVNQETVNKLEIESVSYKLNLTDYIRNCLGDNKQNKTIFSVLTNFLIENIDKIAFKTIIIDTSLDVGKFVRQTNRMEYNKVWDKFKDTAFTESRIFVYPGNVLIGLLIY